MSVVIQCEFNHGESIPGEEAYKCIIKNCQPPENRDIELVGNHEFKRNSNDVGLKHVNFKNNPNYNICYSIYPEYEPNASLNEVKNNIYEKFMSRYKVIRDLRASEATLRYENNELKAVAEANQDKMEIMFEKLQETACLLKNCNAGLTSLIKENQEVKTILEMKERQNGSESNFAADIKEFIADETTKDFQIIIDGHEFPVHKFLLAARSPTLSEILKNNPDVENLNLVDISVEIFEIILKFFYTDELPGNDGTNFLDLFTAAAKLKIIKLVECASTKITDQVNKENALTVFKISSSFGMKDLKQKSFYMVKKKYKKINIRDHWIHDPNTMINIIEKFEIKEEAVRDFKIELNKLAI